MEVPKDRKLRFLCLHGKGTSGKIFDNQTATFRKQISPDLTTKLTFDFVDAPYPDGPAAGVSLFYGPPYFRFYSVPAESSPDTVTEYVKRIKEAQDWVLAYIDRNGPYDAVMCFSQGCAVTASLLLYHAKMHPDQDPPFKFAMFICGGVPLQVLADLGAEVPQSEWDWDNRSKNKLMGQASEAAIMEAGDDRWTGSDAPLDNDVDVEGWVANLGGKKITIPTVHIYGDKDPRARSSLLLAEICDEDRRRVFNHERGHEVPRKKEVSTKLVELVEWGIETMKKKNN